MAEKTMDKIVSLAKARGFVYPGSEIYGGLANTWDYGNLGVELKNNVKKAWWKKFIQESPFNVGVDCAILMNPQTWIASGHLGGFSDPLMDCKQCHERFRADKVIEDYCAENNIELDGAVDAWTQEQMKNFIDENQIPCPTCGKHDFTDIRQFNLMFKTFQGVTEDAKNTVYLRPETAQGIFVNFKNVQRTSRKKLPFGIGQIGKSFRNEITPGNFTFRTREFEQMELEFFCKPDTDLEWFDYWKKFCLNWLSALGLKDDEVRYRDHDKEELSFYSKATTDVEFLFPFGWGELWGIADRTDYDLTQHQNVSGQDLTYFDDETKEIAQEIVRCEGGLDRTYIALDYFDASINRISAWVTGFRSFQKALLNALCTPSALLKELQDTNQMSKKMVVMEECKTLPIGDIWEEYCRRCNVPAESWFEEIEKYETEVLVKRA